jgi:hypothetical protein
MEFIFEKIFSLEYTFYFEKNKTYVEYHKNE